MQYIIKNAKVVNEGTIETKTIYIKEGRFAPLPDVVPTDAEVIDATDCYLLPGVIDTHVHFRDGGDGSNPAGDFHTESMAAAAGGVTSIVDMPNTVPQTTTLETLQAKEAMAAEKSVVNYAFMLGATNENLDELLAIDPLRYAAIKLFLGSSTGNMLVNDPEALARLFKESKKLIVAHCEEEGIIQANLANFRADFAGTGKETAALHPQIRNVEACYISSYNAVRLARECNTRLHIAHISTSTELNLLSNQEIGEKNITAEVTPNHLWYDDRDYVELNNLIKCNPAIKSNDHRMGLWAALYDGLLDTIASDHAPHPWESKQQPYFSAPSGIPSIQHTLQMMMEPFFNNATTPREHESLINRWMPLIVSKMSHNPAAIFGIKERGYIRPGYWADAVLIKPLDIGQEVTQDSLLYKCGWSPLEGMLLHSQIVATFINGSCVACDGEVDASFRGQALQFTK